MRRPLIAGNWKMNLDRAGISALVKEIKNTAAGTEEVDVGVFPPYVYLPMVVEALKNTAVIVGGQDLYFEAKGAYTGQISGAMLADIGAGHVLIGHSERRHIFGDGDEAVRKKVAAALKAGLDPMLCIGEKLPDREAGRTEDLLVHQLSEGLKEFTEEELTSLSIAYEPVWAIGTGVNATPDQAGEAHQIIRQWISDRFSTRYAEGIRILYGGSVTPDNVKDLMGMEGVDGALVGGASLKAESFCRLIRFRA